MRLARKDVIAGGARDGGSEHSGAADVPQQSGEACWKRGGNQNELEERREIRYDETL